MEIKSSRDLESQIYRDALEIRKIVFVGEQAVPMELEIEADEAWGIHYVGYEDGVAVVTARYYVEPDQTIHIQRVATLKTARGKGYASVILKAIEADVEKLGYHKLSLGAQDTAQTFYEQLGYQVAGEQYLDAGIEHHQMIKNLK